MRVRFWKGSRSSAGARRLAAVLDARVLKPQGGKYRPREGDLIVNWGSTRWPPFNVEPAVMLNAVGAVQRAVNKLIAFRAITAAGFGHLIPDWTEDAEIALGWQEKGNWLMARTVLTGSQGRGLVVVAPDQPVVPAPLYTKYVNGRTEYRIHVLGGDVIDRQVKRRRTGLDAPADTRVRNWDNGWVFCRENVVGYEQVDEVAVTVVGALGLDFGGVDIKFNEATGVARVLEVNTAPGLEGETINRYAGALALYVQGGYGL